MMENWVGRFCSLCALFSVKYRWAERNHEELFHFAMALSNIQMKWNGIRGEDQEHYTRVKNPPQFIGNSISENHCRAQKKYREKSDVG